MKERTFLIIAAIWSLVGLFVLLLLGSFAQPPIVKISDLQNNIGKIVQLNDARVSSISSHEGTVFLTLEDSTGKIDAVYFGSPTYEIIEDDVVAVKGKVQLYKGDLEIVIQELACLSCK